MAILADLTARAREPELMDDPSLPAGDHERALRGLARLNRWSRCASAIWRDVRAVCNDGEVSLLDVATGSADVPIALARKAGRRVLRIEACDISPVAISIARTKAPSIGFHVLDAIRDPLPREYDVVLCSLFLHHLDDADARLLLAKMAQAARRLVVVNDLERTRAALAMVKAGSVALSRSPVVRVDAIRSVRAAFSSVELGALAREAGLKCARIDRGGVARMQLVWRKDNESR